MTRSKNLREAEHTPTSKSGSYRLFFCTALALLATALIGCGGGSDRSEQESHQSTAGSVPGAEVPLPDGSGEQNIFRGFDQLPKDRKLPGERLNSEGLVKPSSAGESAGITGINPLTGRTSTSRSSSATGIGTRFVPGAHRISESSTNRVIADEVLEVRAAPEDGINTAHAQYRINAVGGTPRFLTTDINTPPEGEFWLALTDYRTDSWRWLGPFSRGQQRISFESDAVTSAYGNIMVSIVTTSSEGVQVVGLGTVLSAGEDSSAPSPPRNLTATPAAGGVYLEWEAPSGTTDIAGYRIYRSGGSFASKEHAFSDSGRRLSGGTARFYRTNSSSELHFRVTAIDVAGNESQLSEPATAAPSGSGNDSGTLTASPVAGPQGMRVTLNATSLDGASYDWDPDGDGEFEVTGTENGTRSGVTLTDPADDQPVSGILRASVRARNEQGDISARRTASALFTYERSVGFSRVMVHDGRHNVGDVMEMVEIGDGGVGVVYRDAEEEHLEFAHRDPGDVTEWRKTTLTGDFRTSELSMAVIDGKPAVSYYDGEGEQLKLQLVRNPGENNIYTGRYWSTSIVDDAPAEGNYQSLAEIAGRPALVYYIRGTDEIKFALNSAPNGAGGWARYTVATNIPAESELSLLKVDGHPAVAYRDPADGALKLVRNSESDGSGGWSLLHEVPDPDRETPMRLEAFALVGDRPALLYYEPTGEDSRQYRLAVSDRSDGTGSWESQPVPVSADPDAISLLSLQGKPAVSYYDILLTNSAADGSSTWREQTVSGSWELNTGSESDAALIDGKPALIYSVGVDGRTSSRSVSFWPIPVPRFFYNTLQLSVNSEADASGQWSRVNFGRSDRPTPLAIAEHEGEPVIAYDDTEDDLMLATATEDSDKSLAWRHSTLLTGNGRRTFSVEMTSVGDALRVGLVSTVIDGSDEVELRVASSTGPEEDDPAWSYSTVDSDDSLFLLEIAEVRDRTALLYVSPVGKYDANLKYAIQSGSDPDSSWRTSVIAQLDSEPWKVDGVEISSHGGEVSVGYFKKVNDEYPQKLHLASNSSPDGTGSWSSTAFEGIADDVGLSFISGVPMIIDSTYSARGEGGLSVTRLSRTGESTYTWKSNQILDQADPGLLFEAGGKPVLVHSGDGSILRVSISDRADGQGRWSTQSLLHGNVSGISHLLSTEVREKPALAYMLNKGEHPEALIYAAPIK